MLFTTGNLITLGIVLVVLVVYRQLDRDNRSLEKVKKYADRLRDELSAYVDKRSEDLKRFGIDLDVRQKAAKVALDRVQSVQEGLSARAEAIGGIEKRLAEYDTALARLMDMTSRVDENLARLRQEAEFTDSLSKNVELAKKDLESVRRDLPALREHFARDSAAALDGFKEGLLGSVGKRLDEVEALSDRAVQASSAGLKAAEAGRAEAERDIARALEKARHEAEKLEDAAFAKLKEGTDAKAQKLKELIEERFAQLGALAKDKVTETQSLVKNFKAEWKQESTDLLAAGRAEAEAAVARLGADISDAETRATATTASIAMTERSMNETAQRIAREAEQFNDRVLRERAAFESSFELSRASAESDARAWIAKLEADVAAAREHFEKKLREDGSAIAASLDGGRAALENRIAEGLAALESTIAFDKAAVDAAVASNREAAESRLAEARTEVSALAKAVRDELGAAVQADRDTLESLIKSDRVALETRIKHEIGGIESRIANEGVSMQARIFDDFSRRLAEYGSVVEARFEKLEAAGSELGALDQGLRASMDQAVRKIEGDFASYDASLEERRSRFEEAFLVEAGKLRASMKALEQELESLKARAYDNVSEKLKVFEDDFAADLRARGEQIDARLASWRADMDGTLAELAAKAASDRAQAERAATEEARAKSAETQARLLEQLDTMRARVQAIQDGIQAQSGMASESLAALKETVLKDAADARSTAQAYVEGEIARFQLEAGSRLKAVERETDARLAALSAAVAEEEGRVRETREAVAEAAESFRARFAAAVAEAEAKARSELQAFSASAVALIEDARRDYEEQRDGYMASAQSERDRLAKELSGLADRGSELRSDLSARIAQALEGFARGHEAMMADLDRKRREAQAEADLRLREYKDAVQDLGLKIEAARTQALGKIDAEAARVAQSLAELDKEQKAFIAQSKVFEKTDELREALSAGIEAMKADLSRLEGRKAEIAEIEAQLGRVKRLEDEVNQKVTRFLAEKRRIDALEADFDKLSTVSATVDKRLEEVTNQADALTEAQAGIRRVLELSKEAEAKYDRLEKKAAVLDSTAEAVDKNFQSAQAAEKLINAMGSELRRLPDRITELKRSVDELAAGREKTEEAVAKLGELDGIIADAEKRISEAQKAREWLARAETRLEEIDRRAQEQLKLLSTLLKDEGKGSQRERGAPPSSVQDTVRKLARQGWTVDEIARAVKISRGEVELILELGAKD